MWITQLTVIVRSYPDVHNLFTDMKRLSTLFTDYFAFICSLISSISLLNS